MVQIKKSLVDIAYEIIEEKIVTLCLEPGMIISEKQISEEIGIGRMPVREALKRLEGSHLIHVMPRRGMMIAEIKLEEIFQQIELRRAIEGLVMRDAAINATVEERENFLRLAEEFEAANLKNDSKESVRIDNLFNLLSVKACKNPFLKEALKPLHALARRLYYINYSKNKKLIDKINDSHYLLMKMIAEGDSEGALEISNNIIDNVELLYKDSYLKGLI